MNDLLNAIVVHDDFRTIRQPITTMLRVLFKTGDRRDYELEIDHPDDLRIAITDYSAAMKRFPTEGVSAKSLRSFSVSIVAIFSLMVIGFIGASGGGTSPSPGDRLRKRCANCKTTRNQ